jgi:hypothetical protein
MWHYNDDDDDNNTPFFNPNSYEDAFEPPTTQKRSPTSNPLKTLSNEPLDVLASDTDIALPHQQDVNLSWVFTRQEQQLLDSWWQKSVHLKSGRPSNKSQAGLPTDAKMILGDSGKLRLRLSEWVAQYYQMNLREFADLSGFSYNQLLYWNQGRSTPTMTSFLALLTWFKEGDIRAFFQIF